MNSFLHSAPSLIPRFSLVIDQPLQLLIIRTNHMLTPQKDPMTSQSRGVGFVRYDTRAQAEAAIAGLNGVQPEGCPQPILVKFADTVEDKLKKRQKIMPPYDAPYGKPPGPPYGGYGGYGGARYAPYGPPSGAIVLLYILCCATYRFLSIQVTELRLPMGTTITANHAQ